MTGAQLVGAPRAHIDALLKAALADDRARHLAPILTAALDDGIAIVVVQQHTGPFALPTERPAVVLIGDDAHVSLGPDVFDTPSIKRLVKHAVGAAIVSCEPLTEAYATVAAWVTAKRRHAFLIETRPAWEQSWLQLIKRHAPKIPLIIATVRPRGRA